jgi:hypothetical protein
MKTGWQKRRFFLAILLVGALLPMIPAWAAIDTLQRSLSTSKQFVVYCPDVRLRLSVVSFVETAKHEVLETLGLGDHWQIPIIVNLQPPVSTDTTKPLRQINLVQTEAGWKVQVDVVLEKGQLKQVRFPELILRAVLLELAYRKHPPVVGAPSAELPSWLVEGLAQAIQMRSSGGRPNAALFRQLIDSGRLPAIADFLKSNVEAMDPTSLAIYGTCSLSLLEMLVDLNGGKAALARMVMSLGDAAPGDPVTQLLAHFPALGGSETALEKWWTLGVARSSKLDSHLALSVAETDARLTPLLTLSISTDSKAKTAFPLADFKSYLKYPDARAALFAQSNALAVLLPQAHPLLRPAVLEYQRIVLELARGKKRGIDEALQSVGNFRGLIVERMDKIVDYLNWYEATQMPEQSGAFDDYLRGAKALEKATPPKGTDVISKYIDQVEREFE